MAIDPRFSLTPFQMRHVKSIMDRVDFHHLCFDLSRWGDGPPRKPGPIMITFYTKDDKLHAHWLGQRRVIRQTSVGGAA